MPRVCSYTLNFRNGRLKKNDLNQLPVTLPKPGPKRMRMTQVILDGPCRQYIYATKMQLSNLKSIAMKNETGNIMLAALAGAVVGAGVGILFAPDKGSNTRKKIKEKVDETRHDLTERLTHAKDELTRTAKEKREAFEDKLEDALSHMSYKADDIIAGLERKLEDLRKKNAQLQK